MDATLVITVYPVSSKKIMKLPLNMGHITSDSIKNVLTQFSADVIATWCAAGYITLQYLAFEVHVVL